MELSQIPQAGRQVVEQYGAAGFRVSGTTYRGPLLLFPSRTMEWSGELSLEGLAAVIDDGGVELLLLGLGRRMMPLVPGLRADLKARGLAVEAMDTGAACRTYNVLLAEDRRVAAALLPPV